MFNQAFFIRVLIAVVVAVILIALIPPVLRVIGFPANADIELIIKLVVAAVAIFYVFGGSNWGRLP